MLDYEQYIIVENKTYRLKTLTMDSAKIAKLRKTPKKMKRI